MSNSLDLCVYLLVWFGPIKKSLRRYAFLTLSLPPVCMCYVRAVEITCSGRHLLRGRGWGVYKSAYFHISGVLFLYHIRSEYRDRIFFIPYT